MNDHTKLNATQAWCHACDALCEAGLDVECGCCEETSEQGVR